MKFTTDNVMEPNIMYCIIKYEGYLFSNLKLILLFGAQLRND